MSQFRRMLLMMMQKVQEIWRDVVLTGTGLVVANDTTAGQPVKIFPQGWTKQNQYEGKNLFDISKFQSGTTNINNGDGSITLTAYAVNLNNKISDVLTDVKTGDVLYTSATNGTLIYIGGKVENINQNKSIEITDEVLKNNIFGFYGSYDGEITISDIMISKAYKTPYEPYTGSQPSPSPSYPQPILNAGTYNAETGKYEYTLTVSDAQENPTNTQSVTITSDRPLTKWDRLVYMDGQWQWEYGGVIIQSYNGEEVQEPYYSTTGQLTTGAEVQYQTDTPTYVSLPESEQQSINALTTYYPTTVFSNDQNGFMQIEYRTKYGGDA